MTEHPSDIPHSYFDLESVDSQERYDLWRDSIACLFSVEADADTRVQSFKAEVEAWQPGALMLARTTTQQQQWRRSTEEIARDGLDHYMIQLFMAGSTVVDAERQVKDDQLLIFDLSRESHTYTSVFTNLSLIIPRVMLEPLLDWPDHQHLRTLSVTEPLVAVLRDHMQSLHGQISGLSLTAAERLTPATLNLVAACLNGSVQDLPLSNELESVTDMRRIRHYIAANLASQELSPTTICSDLGLSRSRLYRMFEPQGGVAGYIRECRLKAAFQSLSRPELASRKLYEVAQACGFRSNADFSRSFRRRYGLSPREMRNIERHPQENTDRNGMDRRYEQWLLQLSG
ncbi:MAG: helix-turn-helix domain-containing protein [Marinobacterium sp.]|nr:helix-turn-helix domain-containing protein [Marinobacterium sp.]